MQIKTEQKVNVVYAKNNEGTCILVDDDGKNNRSSDIFFSI